MSVHDTTYHNLVQDVLNLGTHKEDRTGTGTISLFGTQSRYNLQLGFPLLTTKKVFTKGIIHELLWLLSGSTNTKYLTDNGVHIWDEWADRDGNLGPVYGHQWRSWTDSSDGFISDGTIDQITQVIEQIKTNPDSRRHIVTAWNPADLDFMALPPCHMLFQFYVADGKLSCRLDQRSGDLFLGVPFNIASYSLLTHMVAQECGLEVGEFIHQIGDAHIYLNHMEQVEEQLTRDTWLYPAPTLSLNPEVTSVLDFTYDDIKIEDYESYPAIFAPVAV